MYRIPTRAKRRRFTVSIVDFVCNVRSRTYQSRQTKRETLRSSLTVGSSSHRYVTIDTILSRSAVLVGLMVHFKFVSPGGSKPPAGLSRCAIRCRAAAWRALVRFLGVVIVMLFELTCLVFQRPSTNFPVYFYVKFRNHKPEMINSAMGSPDTATQLRGICFLQRVYSAHPEMREYLHPLSIVALLRPLGVALPIGCRISNLRERCN